MARILAIDYGIKRCGIAETDPMQIIASGLTTVSTAELMSFLKEYTSKNEVECFVFGESKTLNNQHNEIEIEILKFIEKVKKDFDGMRIARVDERFTSKIAFQTMIDGGLKKKKRRDKALIDQISATIILQSYLETKAL